MKNKKATSNWEKRLNLPSNWKERLHEIIYEADTPMGKWFDISLFIIIIISVILVMLESVEGIDVKYHSILLTLEWIITIFFTIEYVARIVCIGKPFKYIFSFYGIIDFVSTIPLYLSYLLAGSQALLALRALRLLRVFRILKLVRFLGEASQLTRALKASRAKISVFLYVVFILAVILGTLMYLIEGSVQNTGFTSIPTSIYWTIVTLTTVGYGDIAPQTILGQMIATVVMLLGYGIIAVPTGIVTMEFGKQETKKPKLGEQHFVHVNTQSCPNCSFEGHRDDADYCYNCGSEL
ncbi:ion transporter [Flavobacteriaceae bacterium F89]|uniref:Ion transporter n=1 Tax=Cerina litoralis TaxID=2874477 RepID=A0AAE3EWQ9_9FLAO|nr:ion transporter [Cerina litoralis]MCG2461111.1 ion transporter [Cerina litoralis]